MTTDPFWSALGDIVAPDPEQADAALKILAARGEASVEPLALMIRMSDVPGRKAAMRALGLVPFPSAVSLLIAALHDAHEAVRIQATDSLVQLGSQAVPLLLETFNGDMWSGFGTQLRRLGDPQLVAPVVEKVEAVQDAARKSCVEALARINDDRALDALASMLHDADDAIRGLAADALARRPGASLSLLLAAPDDDLAFRQRVADALVRHSDLLGEDAMPVLLLASRVGRTHVRWVADTVLSQLATPDALGMLQHALSDPDEDVRLIAVESVREVTPGNIEPLIEAVRDVNPLVRRAAVKALATVSDARVLDVLVEAANDEDAGVRNRALAAVGSLSSVNQLQPLVNALASRDAGLRKTAADALANMEASVVVPSLVTALAQDAYGDVARVLGRLGDVQAVPPLLTALQVATYVSRQAIVEALGLLKDRRGLSAAMQAMKDDTANVREAAVIALDRLAAPESIPILIDALTDTAPNVRAGASHALAHMGPLVLQALQPSLDSADWRVRLNTEQVLGSIGDVRAVEPLIRKLHDPAGNVCGAAITELKRLADARCIGWLLRALEDRELFVRESVADVLMAIGDSYTLPRLVLAESRLTPRDRAAILDYMRRVRYSDRHITFRFTAIGDVVAYCMQMRNETDAQVQEGAQTVLEFIKQLRDSQTAQAG